MSLREISDLRSQDNFDPSAMIWNILVEIYHVRLDANFFSHILMVRNHC